MAVLFLIFKEPPYYFPKWLYYLTLPPAVYEGSFFPTSSPTVVVGLPDGSYSNRSEVEP
jgi:hypothetical protein